MYHFLVLVFIIVELRVMADEGLLKNSTRRVGSNYWTVCSGSGPSIDIARKQAIEECKLSAADQLQTSVKTEVFVVNTEISSGIHQEIKDEKKIYNLICEPTGEDIKENSGFYQILIQCKFDLSKTSLVVDIDQTKENKNKIKQTNLVIEKRRLTIATSPKCDSILVISDKSNIIECSSNPVSLVIEPETKELIIRAENYKPYRINKELGDSSETLQIILDHL